MSADPLSVNVHQGQDGTLQQWEGRNVSDEAAREAKSASADETHPLSYTPIKVIYSLCVRKTEVSIPDLLPTVPPSSQAPCTHP